MVTIKFRGYTLNNEMSNRWVVDAYGICRDLCENGEQLTYILSEEGKFLVDENTIGRYIGLADIYNKEIYEGDIVRVYDGVNDEFFKGYVESKDDIFYINVNNEMMCKWSNYKTEIIGNLHDNLEMLNPDALNNKE